MSVERSQIWDLLAFALDMSTEERLNLLETVRNEGGDALIRQVTPSIFFSFDHM